MDRRRADNLLFVNPRLLLENDAEVQSDSVLKNYWLCPDMCNKLAWADVSRCSSDIIVAKGFAMKFESKAQCWRSVTISSVTWHQKVFDYRDM